MEVLFTNNQVEEFYEIFNYFDKDRSGTITPDEFTKVLRSLGITLNRSELEEIMQDHDDNNDGSIDFPEFLSLLLKWTSNKDLEEEKMKEAFRKFDANGDGYITAIEFRFVMNGLGENLTEKEAEEIIKEVDINGDGRISYQEFVKLMS